LVTLSGVSSWSGGTISSAGSLTLASGATLNTSGAGQVIARPMTNLGTINVNAGSLELDAFPSNAGTIKVAAGTVFSTGGHNLDSTGTISGSGTIELGGQTL